MDIEKTQPLNPDDKKAKAKTPAAKPATGAEDTLPLGSKAAPAAAKPAAPAAKQIDNTTLPLKADKKAPSPEKAPAPAKPAAPAAKAPPPAQKVEPAAPKTEPK